MVESCVADLAIGLALAFVAAAALLLGPVTRSAAVMAMDMHASPMDMHAAVPEPMKADDAMAAATDTPCCPSAPQCRIAARTAL